MNPQINALKSKTTTSIKFIFLQKRIIIMNYDERKRGLSLPHLVQEWNKRLIRLWKNGSSLFALAESLAEITVISL
jgi:hypothetical protein